MCEVSQPKSCGIRSVTSAWVVGILGTHPVANVCSISFMAIFDMNGLFIFNCAWGHCAGDVKVPGGSRLSNREGVMGGLCILLTSDIF